MRVQPWQGVLIIELISENAEIAQLVEHNLAKVGVASSSLVFRSKKTSLKLCFREVFYLLVL